MPDSLNPKLIGTIKDEIDNAIKAIALKHGVLLKTKRGGTYTPANCTIKVELAIIGAGGAVQNKEANAFKLYAPQYGLQATDFNQVFSTHQGRYRITGLATRSYKFPILAEKLIGSDTPTGKIFKFQTATVIRGLDRNKGKDVSTALAHAYQAEQNSDESGDSFSDMPGLAED